MPGMENHDWFIQQLKPAELYTASRFGNSQMQSRTQNLDRTTARSHEPQYQHVAVTELNYRMPPLRSIRAFDRADLIP